jgi:hypothetical protein
VSILGSPEGTPAANPQAFAGRPLLLPNAGCDQHVDPAPARRFAEQLRPLYRVADREEALVHREWPESDHFVRPQDWAELWETTLGFLRRWG